MVGVSQIGKMIHDTCNYLCLTYVYEAVMKSCWRVLHDENKMRKHLLKEKEFILGKII